MLKQINLYVPITSHSEKGIEVFCEYVGTAVKRTKKHYIIVMGEFNFKLGTK